VATTSGYPVSLAIDHKETDRNRLTTFFRPFVAIPILIIVGLLSGGSADWQASPWSIGLASAGFVFLPTVLMILFRKKYPKWWFDWNLGLTRFALRVGVFMALIDDVYPSTDEEQGVHLDIKYPDAQNELMRGMPLVKWFLAIPHYIVLAFVGIAVFVCIIANWFVILFTGKMSVSLGEFIKGFIRWETRVMAYAFLLTTDKYPPFSLS
jgi:hypothetical protein